MQATFFQICTASLKPSDTPHLLGNQAELFSRQVLKVKDEPPVEVAVSVQRPVVDVSLLLVVLHARHPADHREQQV